MCGIAGAIGGRDAAATVRRMTSALRHRGPDGQGVVTVLDEKPNAALGHTRLAILDLSPWAAQPMWSADGAFCLVFNGEIYNFRELRTELARDGARFRGDGDTTVLLEAWAHWGPACVSRLRGMYAFAMWDSRTRTCFLARDPFGIKPLYLARQGGVIAFASELRALLAADLVERRMNPDALAGYLATGSVPEPTTLIDGIEAVAAGSVLAIQAASEVPTIERVGGRRDPLAPSNEEPGEIGAGRVREALRDSVTHHLVSDVPLALFLSGGIDSSAVVAVASEVSEAPLDTFTAVFDERDFSEREFARAVARRFGTRHHEVPIDASTLLASLPDALAAMDQPSLDGLNTFAVSRAVRAAGIKVVLSGLGGDELFAGYPSFARAESLSRWTRVPGPVRQLAAGAAERWGGVRGGKAALGLRDASPASAAYRASRALFADGQVAALTGLARGWEPARAPAGLGLLAEVSWYEASLYMRDTLLRDSDAQSMVHGLELRVPFVDPVIAGAVRGASGRTLLERGRSKPLLVSAVEDLLPRAVWDRPKQGFVLPIERWLRSELAAEVGAAFDDERLGRAGLAPRSAQMVWDGFRRGAVSWSRPWAIYSLVRWLERHDVSARVAPPARLAAGLR